jgi:hypothetical protein
MRIFNLDNVYSVVCNTKDTRNGFKHEAVICINGYAGNVKTKICYLNRTWERFTYEDVLIKVVKEGFERVEEQEKYLDIISKMS